MTLALVLPLSAALLSVGLALFVLSRRPCTPAHVAFGVAMVALAVAEFCKLLAAGAALEARVVQWQSLRLGASGLGLAGWLLFSLTYARRDARRQLRPWLAALAVAFLAPVALL